MNFEELYESAGKRIGKIDSVEQEGNTIKINIVKRNAKNCPCDKCKKKSYLCSNMACIKLVEWSLTN